MMQRGRKAEYRNAAEKQKAYRDRQRTLKNEHQSLEDALRNSSTARDQHLARLNTMHVWSSDIDHDYPIWLKEDIRLLEVWWTAHSALYHYNQVNRRGKAE